MINIVSSSEMKEFDANTINKGISSITLMKRASNFLLDNINNVLSTIIVVGSGNNGGDGLSLAEDLAKINKKVTVLLISEVKTDSAKYYYDRILKQGVNVVKYTSDFKFDGYEQIIDCIFGVGLSRDVSGVYEEVISKINNANSYVVSADIASGLNSNNGKTNLCVKADKTVTFGAVKLGHYLGKGKDHTGELICNDIGIDCSRSKCKMYQKDDFKCYFEDLKQDLHKYTMGKVTIIGGSKNYVGAPLIALNALVSLRVGAGLSTIAVPDSLVMSIRDRVLEQTLYSLSSKDDSILFVADEISELVSKSKAIGVGMGIGTSEEIKKLLAYLLNQDIKLLIDADALTVLSKNIDLLLNKKAQVILTPHMGEFSRLTGKTTNEISENPVDYVVNFSKKYQVVTLLKGATTIISDGERVAISPYGTSCLAKGGSGDCLSGIITGLLAKNDTFTSGIVGAYILGRCGEILEKELSPYSVIASDIINKIPEVIKEIRG